VFNAYRTVIALLLLPFLLACAACSPASPSPLATPDATPEPRSPLEDIARAEIPSERPTWTAIPLTNVASGDPFALADFAGRTVYVQPMALPCEDCRARQQDVLAVREQLGSANYVYISLSIDPSDTVDGLQQYAERENFPCTFAVAPSDMLLALSDQFGKDVVDLSLAPHFVISPSGAVSQLATGQTPVEQLIAELNAAAGA
jgi:hypothetical protein